MLQIRETFVNETKGYQFSETDWYEAFTDDRGRLFRDMQREYGRASKMYEDRRVGPAFVAFGVTVNRYEVTPVGWVFTRRERYEDARGNDPERDFYTREVWVQVREIADED